MKKLISCLLAVIFIFGCVSVSASAADESVTVSMVNCNVAGLPNVKGIFGLNDVNVSANQKVLANYFNNGGFDIVAVQEDFSYHADLEGALEGFNYQTVHTGSFLGGDGMNIYTKSMAIYNETRTPWNTLHGVINGGADELSNKGILYTVIEIGNGIYVDFYDIHADAYGEPGDRDAREDNYAQIAEIINSNYAKNNRPVIITGDFNYHLHTDNYTNSNMRQYFFEQCGLKDAWIEECNGGDYNNFDSWIAQYGNTYEGYWGVWDSVERFMYKDGGGVTIDVDSFKYTWVTDDEGVRVSDHAAAECVMTFTKTADFVENTQPLEVTGGKSTFVTELMWFLTILMKLFANFDQVIGLLG